MGFSIAMPELITFGLDTTTKMPLGIELVDLSVHGDHRGSLIAVESGIHVPFQIERIYTLFHTTGDMVRGAHAHIGMKQLILNISGSFKLLLDDGQKKLTICLDKPGLGVYISGYIWRELSEFSSDSVINCYVDKQYNDCIYVRDYDEFIAGLGAV